MTVKLRDMVTRALRIIGVLDAEEDPLLPQLTSGRDSFNQMTRSLAGNGLGGRLIPVQCSADTTAEPGSRLMCGVAEVNITLPANPKNGDRVGVADSAKSFATYNAIILPGNRSLEGNHASLTISTNDDNRTWIFCDHAGNWEKERDLALDDTPYWSEEAVDALTHMLAGRLATEYGVPISETLAQLTVEARATIVRRYGRRGRFQNDPAIGVVSPSAVQRQPTL